MIEPVSTFDFVCKVVCASDDGHPWVVYLPGRLLWSAAGMAELFRICRSYLANPNDSPEAEEKWRDTWDMFHIISIKELRHNSWVIDIPWQEPGEEEGSS